MSVTVVTDDIFQSTMQWLVIPVNCVGIMGAGLAKAYKECYQQGYQVYRRYCTDGALRLGTPVPTAWDPYGDYRVTIYLAERPTIFFPTKHHWRRASHEDDIIQGLLALEKMVRNADPKHFTGLAVPALGCGLGGLDWDAMQPVFEEHFSTYPCDVELYAPQEPVSYDPYSRR